MKKAHIFAVALLTFLSVEFARPMASLSELPPLPLKPKLLIPHAFWEPIFFESINKRAKIGQLPGLRSYCVPRGDIEVRIWSGFGLTPLEGVRLQRTNGIWSGTWLYGAFPRNANSQGDMTLPAPKSGWSEFWRQMEKGGIATLPDASQLKNDSVYVFDGMSHVVEMNRDGVYRTYEYSNPIFRKRPEDKRLLELMTPLNVEFGLGERRKKVYAIHETITIQNPPTNLVYNQSIQADTTPIRQQRGVFATLSEISH